jgi:hypothetical protein
MFDLLVLAGGFAGGWYAGKNYDSLRDAWCALRDKFK